MMRLRRQSVPEAPGAALRAHVRGMERGQGSRSGADSVDCCTVTAQLARFLAAGAPDTPTPAQLCEAFLWSEVVNLGDCAVRRCVSSGGERPSPLPLS